MSGKNNLQRGKLVILFVMLAILACGCGGGRTLVINRPDKNIKAKSLRIVSAEGTVDVPEDFRDYFEKYLSIMLFEGDPNEDKKISYFSNGSELKIIYRFVQYETGDRSLRYFGAGMGSGEGSLTVEVEYYDNSTDKKIATIQAFGNVTAGFFGGSFEIAIENTAREVAKYTIQNFSRN